MNLGPRPAGQPWSPAEDAQLLALLDSKMDRPSIARKLKRTVSAIVKRRFILKKRRLGRARAEGEGEIGDLPMDGNIFNSQGVHVAVVLGSSIGFLGSWSGISLTRARPKGIWTERRTSCFPLPDLVKNPSPFGAQPT